MTGRRLRIPKGIHVDRKCRDCGKSWRLDRGFVGGSSAGAAAAMDPSVGEKPLGPGVGVCGGRAKRGRVQGMEQKKRGQDLGGNRKKSGGDGRKQGSRNEIAGPGVLAAELDVSASD